jgi:hypothetical protein
MQDEGSMTQDSDLLDNRFLPYSKQFIIILVEDEIDDELA